MLPPLNGFANTIIGAPVRPKVARDRKSASIWLPYGQEFAPDIHFRAISDALEAWPDLIKFRMEAQARETFLQKWTRILTWGRVVNFSLGNLLIGEIIEEKK